jgi:ACS family hexuronate transporter-like MFS transporter
MWWLAEYFPPAEHPCISDDERREIAATALAIPESAESVSWWRLLTIPQVWGLVTAKFLSDAAWFFYSFWLPKYLYDVRDFDTKAVGYYAWIPYAASGVGSLLGGWFSSRLVKSGYSLNLSRKLALGASAALMPWVFLVTLTDVRLALLLFSIAFFGQQSWSTLVMTLPADLFPRRIVGSVAGLVGFGGAMGGVVFNLVVGPVLDQYGLSAGYRIVFAMSSSFHILAFLIILATVPRVQPLKI